MSTTDLSQLIQQQTLLTNQIRNSKNKDEKNKLINECAKIKKQIKNIEPKKIPITLETQKHDYKCVQCDSGYTVSGKNRVQIVYCKSCRKLRQSDILEYITKDSLKIYSEANSDAAFVLLMRLKSDLRLDLHNTLDTIHVNTQLPIKNACCISYVGCLTETRIKAREEIMERINSGQIQFGFLIFRRGTQKKNNLNTFTEIGSKAWVNEGLNRSYEIGHNGQEIIDTPIFIDDSDDHVASVRKIKGVCSLQIHPGEDLLDLIYQNTI